MNEKERAEMVDTRISADEYELLGNCYGYSTGCQCIDCLQQDVLNGWQEGILAIPDIEEGIHF
jgi:hypothetical protein